MDVQKEDYTSEACFVFLKCMELNQVNHDKTICSRIGDICMKSLDTDNK